MHVEIGRHLIFQPEGEATLSGEYLPAGKPLPISSMDQLAYHVGPLVTAIRRKIFVSKS
jgi:hypothetical protein